MQELLEEWITAKWQNRPHDGLRDPLAPGRAFSPNEKYAALVETAGYLPLALSVEDYLRLLPTRWRAVNSYGLKIGNRIYDCDGLDTLRRERSGLADHKDRWEVRHDPYDIRLVWLHDHREDSWITVPWRLLSSQPVPFGEVAWDHVSRDLREQRGKSVTEEAIAEAADDLLQRAGAGPADGKDTAPARKRSRNRRSARTAARTRAAAEPSWPRPTPPSSGLSARERGGGGRGR
ncbi:Mu transposase C-terminal domain-containing protein [Streptomyces odonnellii]|uniref:Mu transposase C-terminal domain-containing protein n=1 Tax=Streptomyces odonnellii TaxID=1417980 RepID=UPI000AAFFC86|nr:Mu transposase C-terminal domain-containing protein [Streptomyces odonnellii]